jgi:uncharacterized membrane protein HdeD (DUF308 family)
LDGSQGIRKEFSMDSRQKTWVWLSAAISFIVGFILVMNDSGAGWFLIIMGIIYIGTLTQPGQRWAKSNPDFTRLALIGVAGLLVILALVAGAVLLMK